MINEVTLSAATCVTITQVVTNLCVTLQCLAASVMRNVKG